MELITTSKKPKMFTAKQFSEAIKNLPSTKTTPKQRDRVYREHLGKKYGKHLLKLGYFGKTKIIDHV